jgi:hypothetical protein
VVVGKRYGSDSMHFGIVGRVLCTLFLVGLPIVMFMIGGPPYGWAFAGLWGLFILPRGMRDVWGSSQRRVRVSKLD